VCEAGFGGVMIFMAGDLSDFTVDGLDHSCWPIWRGKHRQPPANSSEIAVGVAETHCSLCMASFGFSAAFRRR
jgi:hypothetical protein